MSTVADELEAEHQADLFYMADSWMALQGELAAWHLANLQPACAQAVETCVSQMIDAWPPVIQADLFNTFLYSRSIKCKQLRSESVSR